MAVPHKQEISFRDVITDSILKTFKHVCLNLLFSLHTTKENGRISPCSQNNVNIRKHMFCGF